MNKYFDVPENRSKNEKTNRFYSAAFKKLIEFHTENKVK